ncbi:uncharacterized protein LOC129002380 [Macrosteles quadrilineatus]|uniref:uncharacterized protein LOC129002380 n=1 Tax=Macrosteles quadrilineatus TaxID=74068 RepID=UPI0023E21F66|nr:uncharacterized protein LOC129002380 [Macrosteles quadrilineatus]
MGREEKQVTLGPNTKLCRLYDKLETQLRALKTLGVTSDKYASMLYPLVESALPEETLRAWERHRSTELESEERLALARLSFKSATPGDNNSKCPRKMSTVHEPRQSEPTVATLLTTGTEGPRRLIKKQYAAMYLGLRVENPAESITVHQLLHRPVTKDSGLTTKIKPVFDGSTKNQRDNSQPESRFLIKKINDLHLRQLVDKPTRVTKTSSSLIDHILVNNQIDYSRCDVCETCQAVTVREVKDAINKITSMAVGIDEITISMIKMVSPYCIEAVTHLLNVSLATGVFPDNWKEAILIPLAKVGAPSSLADLRPISVLPALSKVLETIVVSQLVEFLELETIIPATQSGFCRGYSTSTALLLLCDDVIKARAEKRCTSLAMLDFSQAFDSIDHDLLLAMMYHYRFDQQVVSWFHSYLNGRCQKTKVGSEISAPLQKSKGVPQGSCLGPVLFTLFAVSMGRDLRHCRLYSYADHAQLVFQHDADPANQAVSDFNSDLDSVFAWSMSHGIKLNRDKCSLVTFSVSRIVRSEPLSGVCLGGIPLKGVCLGGIPLKECKAPKLLGLHFDPELSFSDHVRLRKFDRISSDLTSLGLLPMADLCLLRTFCIIQRVLSEERPQYLKVRLRARSEMRSRCKRQDDMLEMPRVRSGWMSGYKSRRFDPEKQSEAFIRFIARPTCP